jgi:hypothetical protein
MIGLFTILDTHRASHLLSYNPAAMVCVLTLSASYICILYIQSVYSIRLRALVLAASRIPGRIQGLGVRRVHRHIPATTHTTQPP